MGGGLWTNLEDFIIQKGKNRSRSRTQERAKRPKQTLAAISLSAYLKSLADSRKTSLVSCRARTMHPMRKNLHDFFTARLGTV